MRIEQITLFGKDLNAIYQTLQQRLKLKIESSVISSETNDETLNDITLKALNVIWTYENIEMKDEPTSKETVQENLSFNDAMTVLGQATVSGNNPVTFAMYTYKYSGSKEIFEYSENGYGKYSFWGSIGHDNLKIIIPIPGIITEANIQNVKNQRDNILLIINRNISNNNVKLNDLKKKLNDFGSQKSEQIRTQKIQTNLKRSIKNFQLLEKTQKFRKKFSNKLNKSIKIKQTF